MFRRRNVLLWERYLVVCCPTSLQYKELTGCDYEADTKNSCTTTDDIEVYTSMQIHFPSQVSDLSHRPSPTQGLSESGVVIALNVDTESLIIFAKSFEINPEGDIIPKH
jgi:hypothetical protein